MTAATADARAALPPALAEALAGYEEHLRTQRDLSAHTLRGYVSDAGRYLAWTPTATLVLMASAAAAAVVGLWPRLREFL